MVRKIALFFSLALIFTLPWETAITISSLGTLTRLIGYGAAGIWVASVLINGQLRKFQLFHLAVLVFMLFNLATLFWTASYDRTVTRLKTYAQLILLIWFLWDLFTTPESIRLAMQVFIFGAYVTISSQLFNLVSGRTIGMYGQGRFTGAGQNAVELALILSLSLPVAWHLAMTQKPGTGSTILRVINYAYIPLALLATILTASRTSLVTDVPGLLYIVSTMRKIKLSNRVLIFALIVIVFVVIWPLIPQATFDRLSTIGNSIAENDIGGRMILWKGSLAIFMDHPIFGVGSDALGAADQLGSFAHNTFLAILAETGLIGFTLFLAILSIVAIQAIKQPAPYPALWITVIVIWATGVLSLTWEYAKVTWFFMSLIILSAGPYSDQDKPIEDLPLSVVSLVEPDAAAASQS